MDQVLIPLLDSFHTRLGMIEARMGRKIDFDGVVVFIITKACHEWISAREMHSVEDNDLKLRVQNALKKDIESVIEHSRYADPLIEIPYGISRSEPPVFFMKYARTDRYTRNNCNSLQRWVAQLYRDCLDERGLLGDLDKKPRIRYVDFGASDDLPRTVCFLINKACHEWINARERHKAEDDHLKLKVQNSLRSCVENVIQHAQYCTSLSRLPVELSIAKMPSFFNGFMERDQYTKKQQKLLCKWVAEFYTLSLKGSGTPQETNQRIISRVLDWLKGGIHLYNFIDHFDHGDFMTPFAISAVDSGDSENSHWVNITMSINRNRLVNGDTAHNNKDILDYMRLLVLDSCGMTDSGRKIPVLESQKMKSGTVFVKRIERFNRHGKDNEEKVNMWVAFDNKNNPVSAVIANIFDLSDVELYDDSRVSLFVKRFEGSNDKEQFVNFLASDEPLIEILHQYGATRYNPDTGVFEPTRSIPFFE